jgi:hypothetical protein
MSHIATSVKIASMGFKLNPAQEAAVKARAAAKKKVGDLSFKPSDAQRRAILRMETNKTMAELEKALRDEEPAPAPKPVAKNMTEMRKLIAKEMASGKFVMPKTEAKAEAPKPAPKAEAPKAEAPKATSSIGEVPKVPGVVLGLAGMVGSDYSGKKNQVVISHDQLLSTLKYWKGDYMLATDLKQYAGRGDQMNTTMDWKKVPYTKVIEEALLEEKPVGIWKRGNNTYIDLEEKESVLNSPKNKTRQKWLYK